MTRTPREIVELVVRLSLWTLREAFKQMQHGDRESVVRLLLKADRWTQEKAAVAIAGCGSGSFEQAHRLAASAQVAPD